MSIKAKSCFCSALLALSSTIFAAGFSILEQTPSGLGAALAGMTANTEEPSAIYFNPSATAWFDHPSFVMGTHILTGDVRFHDNGKSTLSGRDSGDIVGTTLIPNFAAVYPVSDGLVLNLTMSATSGTETNYPKDWQGRYFAIDTSVAVIEIQPSIAYRITDDLSIGVGFMAQYDDIIMRQKLNTSRAGSDSELKLDGDTWAYGFTAGLTWKPFEKTTVGIGYRSKMRHDISADARINRIPTLAQRMYGLAGSVYMDEADLTLDMPQSVNFGIVQQVTDNLKLMMDIAWTDWSEMDALTVKFKKGTLTGKKVSEKMLWHDSWRFAVGAEYKVNDKWTLRAGTAFDERTVTNHDTKTCKLPDSNRYWASCGVSYQFSEALRFDVSFTHLFFQPSHINQRDSVSGQKLSGAFRGYTNLLSLGMRYDF
jgi:long-chain fatty acid transport protein